MGPLETHGRKSHVGALAAVRQCVDVTHSRKVISAAPVSECRHVSGETGFRTLTSAVHTWSVTCGQALCTLPLRHRPLGGHLRLQPRQVRRLARHVSCLLRAARRPSHQHLQFESGVAP